MVFRRLVCLFGLPCLLLLSLLLLATPSAMGQATAASGESALANGSSAAVQAEDGIRDPLWSRGLGDVYKRQVLLDDPQRGEDPVAHRGVLELVEVLDVDVDRLQVVRADHLLVRLRQKLRRGAVRAQLVALLSLIHI